MTKGGGRCVLCSQHVVAGSLLVIVGINNKGYPNISLTPNFLVWALGMVMLDCQSVEHFGPD